VAALEAIEAFAAKVDSPFTVNFRLAQTLSAHTGSCGPSDRQALSKMMAAHAPEQETLGALMDLFADFGWDADRVCGLAAVSAADVFGAMGSWNDQSFDGELDAEFEALSSRLFTAMNDYFACLLTFD
jgi:hypothetical protein